MERQYHAPRLLSSKNRLEKARNSTMAAELTSFERWQFGAGGERSPNGGDRDEHD
jgi:hypothetical protein